MEKCRKCGATKLADGSFRWSFNPDKPIEPSIQASRICIYGQSNPDCLNKGQKPEPSKTWSSHQGLDSLSVKALTEMGVSPQTIETLNKPFEER